MSVTTYTLGYIQEMLSSLATSVWSRPVVNLMSMGVVEFCWVVDVHPSPVRCHEEWQQLQEQHAVVEQHTVGKAYVVCCSRR